METVQLLPAVGRCEVSSHPQSLSASDQPDCVLVGATTVCRYCFNSALLRGIAACRDQEYDTAVAEYTDDPEELELDPDIDDLWTKSDLAVLLESIKSDFQMLATAAASRASEMSL